MTDTRSAPTTGGGKSPPGGKRRTTPALFYRQVVAELRKVIWPTRNELVTYTAVALTFVIIMTVIVSVLDYLFTKGVLAIFG
ncbi:MAG: preprotein translocase subunit SecE [Streptosporangiaceae bacterium]